MFNKFIDYIKDGSFFSLTQHICLIIFSYYMLNSGSKFLQEQLDLNTKQQVPKEIIKYNSIVYTFLEKYMLFILLISVGLFIIGLTLALIQHTSKYNIFLKYAVGYIDSSLWLLALGAIHYIYNFLQAYFIITSFFISLLIAAAYQYEWIPKMKKRIQQ
ncbi:hypothetical protein [Bacillus sp. RM2(2019)]|uniref:hypothetical protein n=1 Tax=Bacillus sp. RM2(2019) TaxID=2651636 RepID=UPI00124CDBB2|nr:hypothetical protein [Bacillus sp. RM2(2019)]KAB2370987.1 hypothetical protein F8510_30405 [Bacillus sp. RM2(2019)]